MNDEKFRCVFAAMRWTDATGRSSAEASYRILGFSHSRINASASGLGKTERTNSVSKRRVDVRAAAPFSWCQSAPGVCLCRTKSAGDGTK
jgi:hypothetical protein